MIYLPYSPSFSVSLTLPNQWMTDNFLQLNNDKIETLIFGAQAHRHKIDNTSQIPIPGQ